MTAQASTEAEPLALVALTDEERVSIGFAIGIMDILAVSEDGSGFEYAKRRDILRRVYSRARESVIDHCAP